MSFILDALRKSENERQRNQPPSAVIGQGPIVRNASRFWLPLVALLVGINLALLLVMWVMSNGEPAPPQAAPQTAAPAEPADRTLPRETRPAPVYTPPPQVGTDALATPAPAATSSVTAPAPAADEPNLPTLEELLLANAITLPPLKMDIHVYSDTPAERFVFINMNRYNEGQMLGEGPLLVSITPSGIVLRHQGYDFLVTREQ